MRCEDVNKQMDGLLLGDIVAGEARCLEEHIEMCGSCRDEYEFRVEALEHIRGALRHPLPVNHLAELRHQIFLEEAERRAQMLVREGLRGILRRVVAVAAALTLLAWLGADLEEQWRSRTMSPAALERMIERLVNSDDEALSPHSFVLGHRLSLERYLAATTGEPSAERKPEPTAPDSKETSKPTHDQVGSEDVIDSHWGVHYSV